MTCPQPDDDACTDATPCSRHCPHCGDLWQRHVDGNACSLPPVWDVSRTSDRLWIGVTAAPDPFGHPPTSPSTQEQP